MSFLCGLKHKSVLKHKLLRKAHMTVFRNYFHKITYFDNISKLFQMETLKEILSLCGILLLLIGGIFNTVCISANGFKNFYSNLLFNLTH